MNLAFQFAEQDLYSNWFRNGLITLTIGITLYNTLKLPKIETKLITIFFLIITLSIFSIDIYISNKLINNQPTFHNKIYHYLGYAMLIFVCLTLVYVVAR